MDITLEKPWWGLKAYAEARREKSAAEVRVNATGKAFQAFGLTWLPWLLGVGGVEEFEGY